MLFGDSGNVYAFYVRSEGANSVNVTGAGSCGGGGGGAGLKS
jgi:hypothetical protein